MPFRSITDPEQLAELTELLDALCRDFGIEEKDPQREVIARRIMVLFSTGGFSLEKIEQSIRVDRKTRHDKI
jgi:SpoU rRNA methylase family enzyme